MQVISMHSFHLFSILFPANEGSVFNYIVCVSLENSVMNSERRKDVMTTLSGNGLS